MDHSTPESIQQLYTLRQAMGANFPSIERVPEFVSRTLGLLFPHFSRQPTDSLEALEGEASAIEALLVALCSPVLPSKAAAHTVAQDFMSSLSTFHAVLKADALAIYQGDPAAKSIDEVILAYPGFFAIAVFRIAHWLHDRSIAIIPRMITEYAHHRTGVDIHPGATIGPSFVIDHGTGIVIGETTIIAENVKIYQGVTLGALSVEKSLADFKRHPTIERDVVIYANATILGGSTTIGAGSTIGGNVWITGSIPPNSRVYHRSDNEIRGS